MVVLTLILPARVSVVLVRIRMGNFSSIRSHVPPSERTPGWISLNGKGRNPTLLTPTPPLATRSLLYDLVGGAVQRGAYFERTTFERERCRRPQREQLWITPYPLET